MRPSLYGAIIIAAFASVALAGCASTTPDRPGGLFGSCDDGNHAYYCPVYGGTVVIGSMNGATTSFRGLPYRVLPDGRRYWVYGAWLPDSRETIALNR